MAPAAATDGYHSTRTVPGTPCFTVDGFKHVRPECQHFFLTHFHTDHYEGLRKSFRAGTIYCSQVTANLVIHVLGVSPDCVQPLPLDVKVDVCGIQVVATDANHCPGAVMLLFHTPWGTSLFTGDFRYDPRMRSNATLLPLARHPTCCVEALYLDNTFGTPKSAFPPQAEVIQHVVDRCVSVAAESRRCLLLIGTYTIGKERVFTAVGRALSCPVYVEADKFQALQLMGFDMDAFRLMADWQPGSAPCCVVALPMMALSFKRVEAYRQQGGLPFLGGRPIAEFDTIVAFCPTGWSSGASGSYSRRQQGPFEVHTVPYSEHSSFNELLEFVEFLRPKGIIPAVDPKAFQATKADFLRLCRHPPPSVIQRLGGYITKAGTTLLADMEGSEPLGVTEAAPTHPGGVAVSPPPWEESCNATSGSEEVPQDGELQWIAQDPPVSPAPRSAPGSRSASARNSLCSLLPQPYPRSTQSGALLWDACPSASSVLEAWPSAPSGLQGRSSCPTGSEVVGAHRPCNALHQMPVTIGQSLATLRAALREPTPSSQCNGAVDRVAIPATATSGEPPAASPGTASVMEASRANAGGSWPQGHDAADIDLEDPHPTFLAQQRWILQEIQNERRGMQRSLSLPCPATTTSRGRPSDGGALTLKRCQTTGSAAAKKPRGSGGSAQPPPRSTVWQAFFSHPRPPAPPHGEDPGIAPLCP
eukprot:GGOE01014673.1.p1 GENE.GGOE01014673.1~~GGOE01014673.1.p1  ORF type:complete len:713 (+),score=107.91 GGOE01014673.1:34-2139(+)